MGTSRHILLALGAVVVAVASCRGRTERKAADTGISIAAAERIPAGAVLPTPNALSAPRPAKLVPEDGANLFAAMNCDGCHGGGAIGWMGPSLVDGRWRYGGSDEEIFTSIFYGRPRGMPAYGGLIGTDKTWTLVAYIRAQTPPPVVPTTSWLPGGNAAATREAPAGPGPAAEEKASP